MIRLSRRTCETIRQLNAALVEVDESLGRMIATTDRMIARVDQVTDPETIASRHEAAFTAGMEEFRKATSR